MLEGQELKKRKSVAFSLIALVTNQEVHWTKKNAEAWKLHLALNLKEK